MARIPESCRPAPIRQAQDAAQRLARADAQEQERGAAWQQARLSMVESQESKLASYALATDLRQQALARGR